MRRNHRPFAGPTLGRDRGRLGVQSSEHLGLDGRTSGAAVPAFWIRFGQNRRLPEFHSRTDHGACDCMRGKRLRVKLRCGRSRSPAARRSAHRSPNAGWCEGGAGGSSCSLRLGGDNRYDGLLMSGPVFERRNTSAARLRRRHRTRAPRRCGSATFLSMAAVRCVSFRSVSVVHGGDLEASLASSRTPRPPICSISAPTSARSGHRPGCLKRYARSSCVPRRARALSRSAPPRVARRLGQNTWPSNRTRLRSRTEPRQLIDAAVRADSRPALRLTGPRLQRIPASARSSNGMACVLLPLEANRGFALDPRAGRANGRTAKAPIFACSRIRTTRPGRCSNRRHRARHLVAAARSATMLPHSRRRSLYRLRPRLRRRRTSLSRNATRSDCAR